MEQEVRQELEYNGGTQKKEKRNKQYMEESKWVNDKDMQEKVSVELFIDTSTDVSPCF